uniref:Uncharacterized protein n=1 Tax=Rhabditophanes sp. KR3021 TaxID=114890 RepID=A0AC35TH31_9BILA
MKSFTFILAAFLLFATFTSASVYDGWHNAGGAGWGFSNGGGWSNGGLNSNVRYMYKRNANNEYYRYD